jgi:hypothetical protein
MFISFIYQHPLSYCQQMDMQKEEEGMEVKMAVGLPTSS